MIDYRMFDDSLNLNEGMSCFRGHVKIKDKDTNETLVDEDNLILLRTRLFVIKKLFELGEDREKENGYISNDNRKICLFKIGNGGADINATPFQPHVPKFSDTDLSNPVPFIHVTEMKYMDSDFESNPSVLMPNEYELLNKRDEYYITKNGARNQVTNISSYDAKAFNDSSIVFDRGNNLLYADLELEISDMDARGEFINEIGLLMAEEIYVSGDGEVLTKVEYERLSAENQLYYRKSWRDEELATRITFDTISLQSATRSLIIEYRIYV